MYTRDKAVGHGDVGASDGNLAESSESDCTGGRDDGDGALARHGRPC